MHVGLVANTAWLDDELLNFQHLVVGLIDEQVRVTQIVPSVLPTDDASAFAAHVTWEESRWPTLNRHRLRWLRRLLGEAGVELIHAMDVPAWSGAVALGRAIDSAVLLNVNTSHDLSLLARLTRAANPSQVALLTTSEPLERAVRQMVAPAFTVETVPPGVHPGRPPRQRDPEDPLCAVISGSGRPCEYYEVLLEALVDFVRAYPQTQFFFDGRGSDQHALWQRVSRHGLLTNVSLIPRRLGHDELLVRADVLIHPEPSERVRSLTLQAMANGMPVVALADPWVDHLINDETAWVVPQARARRWLEPLNRLMEEPHAAAELGRRAAMWIRRHRLTSQQVSRTLGLYRTMIGEPLRFPARMA